MEDKIQQLLKMLDQYSDVSIPEDDAYLRGLLFGRLHLTNEIYKVLGVTEWKIEK